MIDADRLKCREEMRSWGNGQGKYEGKGKTEKEWSVKAGITREVQAQSFSYLQVYSSNKGVCVFVCVCVCVRERGRKEIERERERERERGKYP